MMASRNASPRLLLLVLVVQLSLYQLPVEGAVCRSITDSNLDCLTGDIVVESGCNFPMNVYEDCPQGVPLFTIGGDDILLGDTTDFILVEGNKLALSKQFDAETTAPIQTLYLIQATAEFNAITVVTYIVNVNENPPFVASGGTSMEQEENNEVGFVGSEIVVKDQDVGETKNMVAVLETTGTPFDVRTTVDCTDVECRYQLYAKESLDYETKSFYNLVIKFTTGDSRGNSSSATLTVMFFVIDVADNPPFWTQLLPSAIFNETDIVGAVVYQVLALDRDADINNPIKYSIVDGNSEGLFKINENTGEVLTAAPIDREAIPSTFYNVKVMAMEQDGGVDAAPPNNATQTTNILIGDVNDNVPTFEVDNVVLIMDELRSGESGPSERVVVTDMDEGPAGSYTLSSTNEKHLSITPSSGSGRYTFTLTPLYVANDNIFDYEGVTDGNYEIVITITATEDLDPTHIGVSTLTIIIKDVNDNSPVFDAPEYGATVVENTSPGTSVMRVSATDGDVTEEFGTPSIRYAFKDCPELAIDDVTGEVTVSGVRSLDYDEKPLVTCTVEARDENGTSTNYDEAVIVVTLTDENDTPPRITVEPVAEVFENASLGALLLTVSAVDVDTDASVTFSLEYDVGTDDALTEWFTVEQVDCGGDPGFCGEIQVKGELDYEYDKQVVLWVVATDNNTIKNDPRDKAKVTISILDVNDESPTLCVSCAEGLKVPENSLGGTEIVRFTATDPDTEDLGGLVFSCSDNDVVTIDKNSGILSVKTDATVDRETEALINITVTVTDKKDNTDIAEVSITVVDVNDNKPVLNKTVCSAEYKVSEDADSGHPITVITATDQDEGIHATLVYELYNLKLTTGKNARTPFAVDPDTGSITVFTNATVERVLDREDEAAWILNLRVYDRCGPNEPFCSVNMDECYMTVVVLDVNDEEPKLPIERTIQAREEFLEGHAVEDSTITAIDGDAPDTESSEIHYEVIGFENSDGVAFELEDIPFEAVDSPPTIGLSGYTEWSCTLKTTMGLTHMVGTYRLIIRATDGPKGGQGIVNPANLNVTINIQDSNDYSPEIVMEGCLAGSNQIISIHENIYTAYSRIPCFDGGEFAQLKYTDDDTEDSNTDTTIAIDPSNSTAYPQSEGFVGQLYSFELLPEQDTSYGLYVKATSSIISNEEGVAYNLTVRATNKAQPRLSSTSWIYVNVLPVNLYKPAFCEQLVDCVDTAYIPENVVEDFTFRNATDRDNKWEEYDKVWYYIIGGDVDRFVIPDEAQPVLRPTELLDRENKDTYTVLVQAINPGTELGEGNTPNSTDMMLITVEVLDENDNAPTFEESVMFGSVVATGSPGQEALVLQANDPDLIKNLSFKFTSDFEWEPSLQYSPTVFTIDESTGTVTLGADPHTLEGYCLVDVSVTDELATEHFDNGLVQIFVVKSSEQVPFYFRNDKATLQLAQQNITEILTDTFGCIATVDSITSTNGNDNSTQDSLVSVHFVNTSRENFPGTRAVGAGAPGYIVAESAITSAASDGFLSYNLQNKLLEFGLSLYMIGDSTVVGPTDWQKKLLVYQIVLAVVVVLLGSMLFLLIAAYVVRTTRLERRVKVLTTNTFGSKASELNRAGVDAVPNSNLFRGEGANPVWNTFGGDFGRQDSGSISSGDSVLVGVEDNPEFRDYKGTKGTAGEEKGHGKGGFVTSNNPLFAGLEDEGGEDATKQRRTSNTESQISGDLGVPNFSFL